MFCPLRFCAKGRFVLIAVASTKLTADARKRGIERVGAVRIRRKPYEARLGTHWFVTLGFLARAAHGGKM